MLNLPRHDHVYICILDVEVIVDVHLLEHFPDLLHLGTSAFGDNSTSIRDWLDGSAHVILLVNKVFSCSSVNLFPCFGGWGVEVLGPVPFLQAKQSQAIDYVMSLRDCKCQLAGYTTLSLHKP